MPWQKVEVEFFCMVHDLSCQCGQVGGPCLPSALSTGLVYYPLVLMGSFEQAFGDVERAAADTLIAARELIKVARQLQKAAKTGNVKALKRSQERIECAMADLSRAARRAAGSWPFESDEEERYLAGEYAAELVRTASEQGVEVYERDGQLICSPSSVKILPSMRAVRIDKRQASTIRPSYLASLLYRNQNKKNTFSSGQFLESLHKVYQELVRMDSPGRLAEWPSGRVIQLERIYKLFTSLPRAAREYTATDFARDVYLLEASGHKRTRSGAEVSFPASTGTRRTRGVFQFFGPNGQLFQYSGIRFFEEDR